MEHLWIGNDWDVQKMIRENMEFSRKRREKEKKEKEV